MAMLLGRAAGGGGRIELAGAVPGEEGFDGGGERWCGGADDGRMRWCGGHGWPADGNRGRVLMGAMGDGVAAQMTGAWERGRVAEMDGDDGKIGWRWLQLGWEGGVAGRGWRRG